MSEFKCPTCSKELRLDYLLLRFIVQNRDGVWVRTPKVLNDDGNIDWHCTCEQHLLTLTPHYFVVDEPVTFNWDEQPADWPCTAPDELTTCERCGEDVPVGAGSCYCGLAGCAVGC